MKDSLIATVAVVSLVLSLIAVFAGNKVDDKQVPTQTDNVAAIPGTEVYSEVAFLGGMRDIEKISSIAKTSVYATTTLLASESGTTYTVSASGTTIILPAVATKGANYRFVIGGAVDTGNVIIASKEGDNIEGTLVVAGAVVDCDGEDFLNFVADGENVGDYVEVISNGTNWIIGDSGVLTSAKLTCTDPS